MGTSSVESKESGPVGTSLYVRLLIFTGILLAASLAAWAVFAGIASRCGYAEDVKRFEAAETEFAREEVRLTSSDLVYHRKSHRPDEGRIGTLPQAVRQGYRPCPVCSPPKMAPLPRRPVLAWVGGGLAFAFLMGASVVLLARQLGLRALAQRLDGLDRSLAPGATPPSYFVELADRFSVLRLRSDELLRRLAGSESPELRVLQADAFAIAMLRWAGRWTHREIAASGDIERLEDEVAPSDAPVEGPAAEDHAKTAGHSNRTRWYEQQFEYRQLLWKAAEPSTGQLRIDEGRRLLDRLIRDAKPRDLVQRLNYDQQVLNDLSDLLAETVEFFRRQYLPDTHFHRPASLLHG